MADSRRWFWRKTAGVLALATLAPALGGCGARQPAVASGSLPLKRVVVYRNGVGYFERGGRIDANEVRFRVRGDEVGDFLATMAVIEKGGSSVRSASFPLKLEEAPEEAPDEPEPPEGEAKRPKAKPAKKDDASKLVTVVLNLDGKEHDLQVGYVAETPVWRPSYRLVVHPNGAADLQAWGIVQNLSGEDWSKVTLSLVAGAPLAFQATLGTPVIPPRPSVTDAGEVVQALPQSETSLDQAPASKPMPAPPPPAEPMAEAADYDSLEQATKDEKKRDASGAASRRRPARPMPKRASAAPAASATGMPYGGMAPPPMAPPPPPPPPRDGPSAPRNVSALAAVAVEGSSTRYDIPNPVTVPDKSATMVLLTSKRVSGESAYLFSPSPGVPDSTSHPFRVARFRNQTDGLLERGPIAVFEGGAFLGQGIVDPLPPSATATVPFALDRSVAVDSQTKVDEEGARVALIEAGELTIERDVRFRTTYRVKNGGDKAARLHVKHVRRADTRLHQPPKGTEDNVGTGSALVPVDVAAHGSAELTVDERAGRPRRVDWLSEQANEAVVAYLADPRSDQKAVATLRNAWALRPALVKLADEERSLRGEQGELSRSTEETRRNLKTLEKNPAAGALRAQLTDRLAKAAVRLNEITKRLVEIQLASDAQRVRFVEALRTVKVTAPPPPALHDDPRHRGADARDDLVVDGRQALGHGLGGGAGLALTADEHDLVADADVGHAGDVDHAHVHGDAPDDGGRLPADQHDAAALGAGARQAAVEPLVVADGQRGDSTGLARVVGAPVADGLAEGHVVEVGDAGLPGEDGAQLEVEARVARGALGQGRGPEAVEADAGAHEVEAGAAVEHRGRGGRRVLDGEGPVALDGVDGLAEARELHVGERVFERVFDVGEVGVGALERERGAGADERGERAGAAGPRAEPVGARLDLEVHAGDAAFALGGGGERLGPRLVVDHLPVAAARHRPGAAGRRVAEDERGQVVAVFAQDLGLVERVDAEPVDLAPQRLGRLEDAVAVRVALDDRHQRGGRHPRAQRPRVVHERPPVDLDPARVTAGVGRAGAPTRARVGGHRDHRQRGRQGGLGQVVRHLDYDSPKPREGERLERGLAGADAAARRRGRRGRARSPKPARGSDLDLVGHGLGGALGRLGIAEVAARAGPQVVVELVEQRDARRDVEADDLAVADLVKVLDERAQAVAVGGDEHALAAAQGGGDLALPVGQEAPHRVFQALGEGDLFGPQLRVAGVAPGPALVVAGEGRRRDVVAAPPDLHLLFAVLLHGLGLVEALQGAVHALVEAPGAVHGHPHLIDRLEGDPQGLDGPLEQRGVGDVERDALVANQRARALGLADAGLAERHVDPAGEAVFAVPLALAVA
jgi:uncharacterized protein DUF4139